MEGERGQGGQQGRAGRSQSTTGSAVSRRVATPTWETRRVTVWEGAQAREQADMCLEWITLCGGWTGKGKTRPRENSNDLEKDLGRLGGEDRSEKL